MANIRKRGKSYTTDVRIGAMRRTKSFKSQREAKIWANDQESGLRRSTNTSKESLS